MKSTITLITCFLTLGLTSFGQPAGFIYTEGSHIIGPDGQEFLIRGTNLGNWLVPEGYMFGFSKTNCPRLIDEALKELIGPDMAARFWQKFQDGYISEQDIQYIKSLGMNTIRVPFHYKLFTDQDYLGGRGPNRGYLLMDRLITWCRRQKLYVILDMHCAPGGQTGDNIDDGYGYPYLFDQDSSQELTIQIWRDIASHYRSEPMILGYDLLNEPIAHYFDTAHFNPKLEPLYRRIVHAIREVDTNHLVILGGSQWDSNFGIFGPPFDHKAVYTFHKYWTATTQEVIQSYLDFRSRYQVPIYCGETGENKDEWIKSFSDLLNQNHIGWTFWPYKKINNQSGLVTFSAPIGYDQVVTYAEADRGTFASIRKARPKDMESVRKSLDGFLENLVLSHCKPNRGYILALGLAYP
jgi:aryl-phospho-beta-D-glucosidase BglC (GH1 family)